MEIETSLINVNEALAQGQTLSKGMQVSLPMGLEATIYGFVPVEVSLFDFRIDMPPLGEAKVVSNRVVAAFNGGLRHFPVFNDVSKPVEERYPLSLLYIPRFLRNRLDSESLESAYLRVLMYGTPELKVKKLNGVDIEKGCAYYFPQENDLYFESSSKLSGIANGLAVITRRLSKETDELRYEIFNSDEVLVEKV